MATFLTIGTNTSCLTISKVKCICRASLHTLPAWGQVLEVHTFCARLTVETVSAMFRAFLTGVPNLSIAHLVVASGTICLTPKIRVQKLAVLALGAGISVLTLVAIFMATRALSANRFAMDWGAIEAIRACAFAFCCSSEIQVIVALGGIVGTDTSIKTTGTSHALAAQFFTSNFILTIGAMFNTLSALCQEVGVVANHTGICTHALKTVVLTRRAFAPHLFSAVLVVRVGACVTASCTGSTEGVEPALCTLFIAIASAAVFMAGFATATETIVPVIALHPIVTAGTLRGTLEVMGEIVLILALQTGCSIHTCLAILMA